MSGIFGGGGDGGAGKQIEAQNKQIAKQEAGVGRQQTELARRAMATIAARRGGGQRFLLTGEDPASKTTLGG